MIRRSLFFLYLVSAFIFESLAEGSKNLSPTGSGTVTGTNQIVAYLQHNDGNNSGNFLLPAATANERLYVYIRNGETLYYGIRRIANLFGATNGDLIIRISRSDTETEVSNSGTLIRDMGSADEATFNTPQNGIITSHAQALAGPAAIVGGSGYAALTYTNTTGVDMDFYITFDQQGVASRSTYDIWDFSVYDGVQEKPGRLHSKAWGFNGNGFSNRFSTEMQLFALIPSVVNGSNAGFYVKEIDLQGMQPFGALVFANSIGMDLADPDLGDGNADGLINFLDARRSQTNAVSASLEYDLFVNNPDIDVYPTTTLPTVRIANAQFFCNSAGTRGNSVIAFETNQVGFINIVIDLNGSSGYQSGTTDVLLESQVSSTGTHVLNWDGLDGTGATVASGTNITITGRFQSGPIHIPLLDIEINDVGINMKDVRPTTSFDLIYWDDTNLQTDVEHTRIELNGTVTGQHTWGNNTGNDQEGNNNVINTWSYGFFNSNAQTVSFLYSCDSDGDGINFGIDIDDDNDGITDSNELDPFNDTDNDGIPDYLDPDLAGRVDANFDGINDNYDIDLDGIPNAMDLDSDNDGIPDLRENATSANGLTDSNNNGTVDNGTGFTDANNNGMIDAYDPDCASSTVNGTGFAVLDQTAIANATNALGSNNTTFATLNDPTSVLTLQLNNEVPSGQTIEVRIARANSANAPTATFTTSTDGVNFVAQTGTANAASDPPAIDVFNLVLDNNARFIRIDRGGNDDLAVFSLTYSYSQTNPCTAIGVPISLADQDGDAIGNSLDIDSDNDGIVDVIEAGGVANTGTGEIAGFTDSNGNGWNDSQEFVALALPDTDGDGIFFNYLDLDSDNDGILDLVEGQTSSSSSQMIGTFTDTNNNGLNDPVDPTNGGTLITGVNTDGDGAADYIDSDADGDGVEDFIEGWDANSDGYSDLDLDTDDAITDQTGFNVDTDNDGLFDIFEASNAPTPNSDGADERDWQDTDDDNDGSLTSGEDANTNGNWFDDFVQGGVTIPDYLFRGDSDGDAVPDGADADSDNDGILDTTESNGEAVNPSEDADADGIPNYRDTGVAGSLSSSVDSNSDGVFDVFDTDLDGVPDFLDLDSDNDGVWDGVEANAGAVPNGLSATTGRFALQDPDNDGLMNYIDTDDVTNAGVSDLSNPDTDGDGLNDYKDIDSDGDGITDIIEFQTTAALLSLSGSDSDGDGIDNAFDPSSGGTRIIPTNTDGVDVEDYRDIDSDNDNVPDIVEGADSDNNGLGDWDANTNGLFDDTGFNTDSDGDGLTDIFDNVVLTASPSTNATGTNVTRQNTDGIDFRDWRDNNDDNDNALTANEDANNNGNYADDQTNGQSGTVPDYLFNGDKDNDGIVDATDIDSDNDGIVDTNEDGGEAVDPGADGDNDGIPNYRDANDVTVTGVLTAATDSNSDGVYDVFDKDLDGIPDFLDRDSDNDGLPDIFEAGGTDIDRNGLVDGLNDDDNDGIPNTVDVSSTGGVDSDGDDIDDSFDESVLASGNDADNDGIIDSADPDVDGDGLANTYDPDFSGGTSLTPFDSDSDGLADLFDLDADDDGIPDIIELSGTDTNGDGLVDNTTDTDSDGLSDVTDSDNGGTPYTVGDKDSDGVNNYRDVDSDNDGIPDTVEAGGTDSNNDGKIDSFATDTDNDGLADEVDGNNGGTAFSSIDTDNDGVSDLLDLDSDNDGASDLEEAGGIDIDDDGILDAYADSDSDGIPNSIDVTNTGGVDTTPADGIDDSFQDGADADGDNIENTVDVDNGNNGFNDATELTPLPSPDTDSDGNRNFRDLDADNDGLVDALEFGFAVNVATGTINGFIDTDTDGWDDSREGTAFTAPDTDSDGIADNLDIDSDNDGIVDNIESQTKSAYIPPVDTDSDNDGLFNVYDPNNGGTYINPVNTDGATVADFLDDDSDGDNVGDLIEGSNTDANQYADWDTDNDNIITDETGYNVDNDQDGLWDIFDNFPGTQVGNVIGSNAVVQDTDRDGTWDFQDTDDDEDGLLTNSQGTGNEDADSDGDPTDDFIDDPLNITPNYLFGSADNDGDGIADVADLDSDNDGLVDTLEDGGAGFDPSADNDGDGVANYEDNDIDGDAILNSADTDADGNAVTDTYDKIDSNSDGVLDVFDKDLDGIPDFLDRDSDNDGITDVIEFGLTDVNNPSGSGTPDGTLNEGAGITDANNNGLHDTYEGASAVAAPDTDADGISDHLDLDADDDGITDNRESQVATSYLIPVLADTDADGLLDVYDAFDDQPSDGDAVAGTAIVPNNQDGTGSPDFQDTDSDDDTVNDIIEGWDSNSNGFADWDTDADNIVTDETGYLSDADSDGIRFLFDSNIGRGSLANIDGSNQVLQDTDTDNLPDYRDSDDDGDAVATSSEDNNINNNLADDFAQGGGTTPDYLYNPDADADNISDNIDGDSDNDGILNTDEYAGAIYASGGSPFADADGDGIFNFLDNNDANNTSYTDVNGDGVDDQVDQDLDGVPNFFDLDSDNDGILDAIEANRGLTPTIGAFSLTTGRFSGTDANTDGIVDAVASAPLPKPNFDPPGTIPADGLDDYLDIDSDEDGITDNVEGQTTTGRINPSNSDTDGDGWDNSYDPDNGGTAIVPTNTDATFTISDTEPDYRDIDADNDNDGIGFVGDQIEGFDANRNGFSELDSDLDLSLLDEMGYNVDTDTDGLWDLYDNFSGRGVNNINGTRANLQDTDGDGILDFRDQDDDADNITTAVEDVNNDGNWTNDKVQGGGATPDYLFFNDSDKDRIADGQDIDGDNDGIPESAEYDNTRYRNPFGDQDGDGVFNYIDPNNPNALDGTTPLTDSNSDGIWDEYDTDLDGVPNFFDLDSDEDGIPDIIEAGGTDANNDGIIDGIIDTDEDGLFDNVDVDQTGGTDSDLDGIDDAFDFSVSGGTDADGDDIEDGADFDDDGDGIINVIDPDEGGVVLADADFDGDGLRNRIDLDSDSDGITDLIEARGSDTDGNGRMDTTGDTDGDGWGNLVDPDNGGTPHTLPDTDGDGSSDYLDIDADADGVFDYNEGFDDDEDDVFTDDYTARATAFGNASFYDPLNLFWYNTDSDADNTPDFLDPNSGRFVDTDSDGIIDLFDTSNGGNFYGNVSGKPDNDSDLTENYIDLDGDFRLGTTSITTSENGANATFTVVLTQQPATNVVINVSETSPEVSLSPSALTFTNSNWNSPQPVTVQGLDDVLNDGDISYAVLVSVSDALSDDNFDNASDQNVNGTNLDNEGSIRVSTSTVNTTENGTTVDFTVELSVAPTSNVVLDVTESSDEGSLTGLTLIGGQLTFTNGNWNAPQTVTITPADDALLDGNQVYNITTSVNDPLSDDGFDPAPDEIIAVTNVDDDQGFILNTTAVTTNEDGTTAQFTIVLDVIPASDVIIDLTESSVEGSVSPTSITFNSGNYNNPRTVTVTPADDANLDGNQIYNITVSVNGTSDAAFTGLANQVVSVTNQDNDTTPLPLDLLSFEGEFRDGSVWLNWVTTNERSVDYMAVDRSLDGISYEQIGRGPVNNTETEFHKYSFEDERPIEGFNYYRLNTVDYDGTNKYSEVVIIVASTSEFNINVYPNPVKDQLTILSSLSLSGMSYSIFHLNGKLIKYQRFVGDEFVTTLDLSPIPTGVYQLIITSPDRTKHIRLFKH